MHRHAPVSVKTDKTETERNKQVDKPYWISGPNNVELCSEFRQSTKNLIRSPLDRPRSNYWKSIIEKIIIYSVKNFRLIRGSKVTCNRQNFKDFLLHILFKVRLKIFLRCLVRHLRSDLRKKFHLSSIWLARTRKPYILNTFRAKLFTNRFLSSGFFEAKMSQVSTLD